MDDQGDETPSPRGPQSPHLQPADAAELRASSTRQTITARPSTSARSSTASRSANRQFRAGHAGDQSHRSPVEALTF